MTTKIYMLLNEHNQIKYIGKTTQPLEKRLKEHLADTRSIIQSGKSRCVKNDKFNWIKSMFEKKLIPSIQLIGIVPSNGKHEERAWIAYGKEENWPLTNVSDGGEEIIWTNEARQQVILKIKERTRSFSVHPCFAFRG